MTLGGAEPASRISGILFISVIVCALLVLASCRLIAAPASELSTIIDEQIAANALEYGIPAQSVSVTMNGVSIYQGHTGTLKVGGGRKVDRATVFPIFSVSKLLATILVFEQVEAGRIDLDASASTYVTNLPAAWSQITVRQFLNHVSGVNEYFDSRDPAGTMPATLEQALLVAAAQPGSDPPDTRSQYRQTNFLVIGAVLESVTGQTYSDLVRTRILDMLGQQDIWIDRSAVPGDRLVVDYQAMSGLLEPAPDIGWPNYSAPHTGVYATAPAIAALLDAIASGKFITPPMLKQMWHPHVFPNNATGFFAGGWEYGKSGSWQEVGHDGGAKLRVRILFKDDPSAERFVIVYLTNGSSSDVWSRTLVESVQLHLVSGDQI